MDNYHQFQTILNQIFIQNFKEIPKYKNNAPSDWGKFGKERKEIIT